MTFRCMESNHKDCMQSLLKRWMKLNGKTQLKNDKEMFLLSNCVGFSSSHNGRTTFIRYTCISIIRLLYSGRTKKIPQMIQKLDTISYNCVLKQWDSQTSTSDEGENLSVLVLRIICCLPCRTNVRPYGHKTYIRITRLIMSQDQDNNTICRTVI